MGRATPSSADTHLAALLQQARRAEHHAQILVDRAKSACARAFDLAGGTQVHRQERRAWDALLARLPSLPDRVVILCAYCHRIQGVDGWTTLPLGIEAELLAWRGVMVGHGYCPDCLQNRFYSPE